MVQANNLESGTFACLERLQIQHVLEAGVLSTFVHLRMVVRAAGRQKCGMYLQTLPRSGSAGHDSLRVHCQDNNNNKYYAKESGSRGHFVSCLLWLKCNGPSAMNASLLISCMTTVKNQRKSGEYHIRSRPILSSSLHFSWSSCTVCSSKSSANVQQSLCLGASNLCANGESDLLFIYRLLNSLDGKQ